ncbi:hypothetical protein [Winogradskyella forsetii]|uniref:hypothetical protein n=1 Tax=Winogradskyella forsetii TaxID=2686077 RepID=UPI0015C174D0|nr:hypothetical protein [Winogradskyella forsetii]
MQQIMDDTTKAGFFGGIFLSTIVNIGVEDIITTIILAAVGATVSFIVSLLLRSLTKKPKP